MDPSPHQARGSEPTRGLHPLDLVLLALVALAMVLPGLTRLPPVDRDESRYAQATTQMLETHDFVDVRFQDHARYLQPAGIYWLQAAAVSAFSSPQARAIWAYRLPSQLAAVTAVLLTAWIGAMLYGRAAGLGAGLLLAFSLLLGFEARMAKIDACLLAATLAAQAALLRAWLAADAAERSSRRNAALFWAALGVGLMLKGPIILLVVGGTVVAVGVSARRWRWLAGLHAGWGVLITLAIALPWLVAIGVVSHGAFFEKAVGHNLLGKVASGEQAHGQPPGYYLALFTVTFWPGSLAAAAAAPFVWRERRTPQIRFLLAWIVPTWLLFELIATKLPHYVLPVYPAIACLAAGAATSGAGVIASSRWRIAGWIYGGVWLVVGLALCAAAPAALFVLEAEVDPVVCSLAALAAALVIATAALFARRRTLPALGTAGAAALFFAANTYGATAPQLHHVFLSPRIAASFASVRPCASSVFASSADSEPSLVFLTSRYTQLIGPEAAADFLAADPLRCRLALIDTHQAARFLARAARDGLTPTVVGGLSGRNYSRGLPPLRLTWWRAGPSHPGHTPVTDSP